jgi:lysophospholipase L1-like esterase
MLTPAGERSNTSGVRGTRIALLLLMTGTLFACGSGSPSARERVGVPAASPLLSRGVPVFASSEIYPARDANDADYGTVWRGTLPGWIAYDLSRVSPARRSRVLVAWFNDGITSPYDHTISAEPAYNSLADYTVDANRAPGGGSAPSSGWVTLVRVRGNVLHSRQHLVSLKGFNWVRIDVSAGDGSPENDDAAFNLDVYSAPKGTPGSWLFLGDSITMDGTQHRPVGGVRNFSQLIAGARPRLYPGYEDGGIGGLLTADGARHVKTWLKTFPGRYVGLSYGTNDANACVPTSTFARNYATMVRAVLAAHRVPVVPTIPWARAEGVQRCAPRLNARIKVLYRAYRQVVRGPDLWSYFKAHPSLIGQDGLHPSEAGYGAFRREWARAMLARVYKR